MYMNVWTSLSGSDGSMFDWIPIRLDPYLRGPVDYGYVSCTREGVAKHDDGRIIQSVGSGARGQKHRSPAFTVGQTVHLGNLGAVVHAVLHLVAERLTGEPGLRLDRKVQHLQDEQHCVESGSTLWSGHD